MCQSPVLKKCGKHICRQVITPLPLPQSRKTFSSLSCFFLNSFTFISLETFRIILSISLCLEKKERALDFKLLLILALKKRSSKGKEISRAWLRIGEGKGKIQQTKCKVLHQKVPSLCGPTDKQTKDIKGWYLRGMRSQTEWSCFSTIKIREL